MAFPRDHRVEGRGKWIRRYDTEMGRKLHAGYEATSRRRERVLDLALLKPATSTIRGNGVEVDHQLPVKSLATEVRGHPCRFRSPVVMDIFVMTFEK